MTYTEFLKSVAESDLNTEIIEKANDLLAQDAEKKVRAAEKRAEKNAEDNAYLIGEITRYLADATEPIITAKIATACHVSTPKASAVLRKMVSEGTLTATTVLTEGGARKAYARA